MHPLISRSAIIDSVTYSNALRTARAQKHSESVLVLVLVGFSIPRVNVRVAARERFPKERKYCPFALCCVAMPGLAKWPRGHYESAGLTVSLDASTGDKPAILANVAQKVAVTSVPPRRTASMAVPRQKVVHLRNQ
jgi:hypothetical protein